MGDRYGRPISLRSAVHVHGPSPWPSPRGEDERGRRGGAPVGRRRVGAFWGVDNSERVAIKGRIGKKAPLAKLRTCLSTLAWIHIHKWMARERGMGGERLKSRSFPLFPLSLSLSSLLIQRGNVYIDAFSGFKTGARVTITKLNVKIRALTFLER